MASKSHQKPTKEELQLNIDKSLEEIESNPPPVIPEDEEDDGKPPAKKEEDHSEEDLGKTDSKEKKEEETPPAKKEEEEKGEEGEEEKEDYKEKHKHSTAEAQVLASQNRKMAEAMAEASQLPAPTDEDMIKEYPDWEDMTPFEQRTAKSQLHSERKFALIEKAGQEGKEIGEWSDKVDTFLVDPANITAHPELEGKEEAFKTFAIKPSRRGGDFEDLVSAFLYTVKADKPVNKGKMFETGSGGDEKPKPNDGKISITEARRLRITDYPKYLTFLRAGKIDQSDL